LSPVDSKSGSSEIWIVEQFTIDAVIDDRCSCCRRCCVGSDSTKVTSQEWIAIGSRYSREHRKRDFTQLNFILADSEVGNIIYSHHHSIDQICTTEDEDIITSPTDGDIVTRTASDRIITITAIDDIVTSLTVENIVATESRNDIVTT
jgi:hypothetical protein